MANSIARGAALPQAAKVLSRWRAGGAWSQKCRLPAPCLSSRQATPSGPETVGQEARHAHPTGRPEGRGHSSPLVTPALSLRGVLAMTASGLSKPPAPKGPHDTECRGRNHALLGYHSDSMTPTILWPVLAAIVVLAVGTAVAAAKVRARIAAAAASGASLAGRECAGLDHVYRFHGTGLRCFRCGNYVARVEGEFDGRAEDGRIDRRSERR